jgi:hypothetical protein
MSREFAHIEIDFTEYIGRFEIGPKNFPVSKFFGSFGDGTGRDLPAFFVAQTANFFF